MKLLAAALLSLGLAACATPGVEHYRAEQPRLVLEQYFSGKLDAWGMFQGRDGAVQKRFHVVIDASWQGDTGVLDEHFKWSDGTTSRRVWTLKRQPDGRYTGTAGDVLGEAAGQEKGNAFRWGYTLKLPVDGRIIEVQFDDWMYLMGDKVMLNKAKMSKFGVGLGEVTLSFVKR